MKRKPEFIEILHETVSPLNKKGKKHGHESSNPASDRPAISAAANTSLKAIISALTFWNESGKVNKPTGTGS